MYDILGTIFFLGFLIHIIGTYWEQTSLSVPIPNQRALVHFSRPSTSGAAARDCGPEVRYHVILTATSGVDAVNIFLIGAGTLWRDRFSEKPGTRQ